MIEALYSNPVGRAAMKLSLHAGLPKLMAAFLRSPLSRGMVPGYIRKHRINMDEYPREDYDSFARFFSREKKALSFDSEPGHLISPADSLLSTFPVTEHSGFFIKGSYYTLRELITDSKLAARFSGGMCLIFRLTASDWHHYIFPDSGFSHHSHFIPGELHSVQPIACEKFPVYRLNRRCWTELETENFGRAVQIEVGAMAVGGIVNRCQGGHFRKGEEKGRFELCGSTIVLLLEKGRAELLPELREKLERGEVRVSAGQWIAVAAGGTE